MQVLLHFGCHLVNSYIYICTGISDAWQSLSITLNEDPLFKMYTLTGTKVQAQFDFMIKEFNIRHSMDDSYEIHQDFTPYDQIMHNILLDIQKVQQNKVRSDLKKKNVNNKLIGIEQKLLEEALLEEVTEVIDSSDEDLLETNKKRKGKKKIQRDEFEDLNNLIRSSTDSPESKRQKIILENRKIDLQILDIEASKLSKEAENKSMIAMIESNKKTMELMMANNNAIADKSNAMMLQIMGIVRDMAKK